MFERSRAVGLETERRLHVAFRDYSVSVIFVFSDLHMLAESICGTSTLWSVSRGIDVQYFRLISCFYNNNIEKREL